MKRITEYDSITTVAENDVVPVVDVSDTTQASSGSTKKGTIAKIADYIKDRAETLTNKTLTAPTINGGSVDSNTDVTEVLRKVYPVGSIYISTISTNPNTLFGFGTWAAFGAGKTLVGLDSGDGDFDTSEETGGAKTHTLTVDEMPSHQHTQALGGSLSTSPNAPGGYVIGNENSSLVNATGGGSAHNNLPPYIVTYFFKRTA